jgi:hypothetical protein
MHHYSAFVRTGLSAFARTTTAFLEGVANFKNDKGEKRGDFV